jgi:hypothetical protein
MIQDIALSPNALFGLMICIKSETTLYTVKKRFVIFPSPAGMSLAKLSLDRNNIILPVHGEFGN